MRAIWKGAISLGLVNIPVSLFPALRREELKFRLLRSSDLSPVNYKRGAKKQWLLIRGGEDIRPVSRKADDTSMLSGKSMCQLGQYGPAWVSTPHNPATKKRAAATSEAWTASTAFFEPMEALLVATPPAGDWLHEIKFDGFRALALKGVGEPRRLSPGEKDLGAKFPEIAEAGKARPQELQSMLWFFGTVMVAALLVQALWLLRKLRPERARLERLLRAYDE